MPSTRATGAEGIPAPRSRGRHAGPEPIADRVAGFRSERGSFRFGWDRKHAAALSGAEAEAEP